jgi:type I restriction enzyme S subunit
MHHLTREKFDSLRSGKIQKGDLVYCLRGATLGKTAFVEPYAEGAIASSLVIVRVGEILDRKFLYYFLTSPYGKELVDRFDNGSAQPNLSADSVKNYVIALPSPAEQQEIVRRVEGLFALAGQLELRLAKARGQVDKLTPSLRARAFAGKLVPQDPTDEPASTLLSRIKIEKRVAH